MQMSTVKSHESQSGWLHLLQCERSEWERQTFVTCCEWERQRFVTCQRRQEWQHYRRAGARQVGPWALGVARAAWAGSHWRQRGFRDNCGLELPHEARREYEVAHQGGEMDLKPVQHA